MRAAPALICIDEGKPTSVIRDEFPQHGKCLMGEGSRGREGVKVFKEGERET